MTRSNQPRPLATTEASIHERLREAFEVQPDSGGIIQGVRHFRRGRPHIRLVMAPSPKNGGLMPCEGRLEAQMALSLEIDPDVAAYRCQPFFLPTDRGPESVPDFAVRRHNGTFSIVDVKPNGKLSVPRVKDRMQRVRSQLKSAALPHSIITESDLEAQPNAQIRRALRKASTTTLTEAQRVDLLTLLESSSQTVGALRHHLVQLQQEPLCIEKLALLGHIKFSTHHAWNEFTKLEVHHESDQKLTAGWGTVRTVRIAI